MVKRPERRRGEGTAEYIVIMAIILGVILLIFWNSLSTAIVDKLNEIGWGIQMKKKPAPEETAPTSKPGGLFGPSSGGSGGGFGSGSSAGDTPGTRFVDDISTPTR
jgi:hypothetical protein